MKATSVAIRAFIGTGLFLIFSVGISGTSKAEPGVAEATCVDLPGGAISWWSGDGNAQDIQGNNHGTLQSGTTFAPGMVDLAFSFDGNDDVVEVANSPSVNVGTGDFSIDAWIQTSSPDLQTIIDKRAYSPAELGYHFFTGQMGLGFQMADGGSNLNYDSGIYINDGNFHHVAVTVHRNSSDGGKLFVDGAVVLVFDPTSYSDNLDNTADFLIGAHSLNYPDYGFQGLLDEIDFFNRALTENEILAIFNAGSAGKCKPPIGGLTTNFTASPSIAHPGEPVDFTLILQNPGTTDVVGVQVTDALPSGFDFREGSLSASSGIASYDSGVITWNGDVTAGDQVTIQFGITVNPSTTPGSTVKNTAEILSGGETFYRTVSVYIDYYRAFLACLHNACKPVYFDNFSSSGSGWPVYSDQYYYANYENGEYRILLREKYDWFAVTPGVSFAQSDAYSISVDARSPSADQVDGTSGIIFGINQDWSKFYEFDIGPDGFYSIYLFNSGYWYKQTEGYSSAILPGTATNRLRIDVHGYLIDAYANDRHITQISTGSLSGRVGLITFSVGKGVDTYFDNFTVLPYVCPPGAAGLSQIELGDPETWSGKVQR